MATKQVHVDGVGPVTLYKRRGNRSLRLSIAPNGEVRVSMPYWLPYAAGEKFAGVKARWIALHKPEEPGVLRQGLRVGKAHSLVFLPSTQAETVGTRLKDNQIVITHPAYLQSHDEEVQDAARTAAIRALRYEAERLLPMRLRQLATAHGFTFASVGVKRLTGRWGSCSSQQEITLNLFLMQLPWHLIDYVILHELVHTRVMRHGPPFWQELERHIPHAKQLRKEIGEHKPAIRMA